MPVRQLNRQQTWLLPPNLDELIPSDHPARFVAMIVDSLEVQTWLEMGIDPEGDLLGAPQYHPRAMLSIWLYGFMTSTRTSRKLEAACRDQIPFLWLTGWQHPDHNSIWRFYKAHRQEMRQIFKLTIKTALKMDLIDLAVQAIDGSKIAANAARDRTYDREGLQELLARTEKRIEELEKENEASQDATPVHLPEKLQKTEQLRQEVKAAIEKLMQEEGRKNINLTDEDPKLVKGRQGVMPGYNMEAVVSPVKDSEKKNVLITAVDVITDTTDNAQLIPMIKQAAENVGAKAEVSLADAGYHSGPNLAECEGLKQAVIIPETSTKKLDNPYHKDQFQYNLESDSYVCPHGQLLKYRGNKTIKKSKLRTYRGNAQICLQCPAFGQCTKDAHNGRELKVGQYEMQLQRHRAKMKSQEAKNLYKLRKELIEPVFGIIKEQMGIRRFWLRGVEKVRTEAPMVAAAFNLRTLAGIWRARANIPNAEWITAIREAGQALAT
jgi:transposase